MTARSKHTWTKIQPRWSSSTPLGECWWWCNIDRRSPRIKNHNGLHHRCGHCKKLAPHYTEAAAVLAKHDNIRIGKVDATAHKDRASELGVRGYPSVKVFLNGEFYEDYKKVRLLTVTTPQIYCFGSLRVCVLMPGPLLCVRQAREADAIVKYMRDLSKKASSRGSSGSSASSDPCLAAAYAADHYGECCGNGGVNIAGHLAPCQEARGRGRSEL